ncbi:hypothetical protein GR160_11080 [Flavobacterium sp. Sd200]|uniref:carboxypeptidase-like regulatory domain-containing protein n=1 Tax=Flavobacterium sp. Sd200 TaxID=2692211 RepID=UPI00136D9BD1|nr:carboxypeptidase-like regulatory domain-containing protein [Flavobacterium sp. Sd200]MXN91768.1 hypothetical protein [Flavobacterium sp. Sd200]
MKKLYCALLLFLGIVCHSQIIKGIVIDSLKREPVPYTNVLFKNGKGVACDDEGIFEIDITHEQTLTFSSIGYADKVVPTADIDIEKPIITLNPATAQLDDVVVNGDVTRYTGTKRLGLDRRARVRSSIPFGHEFSAYIKNPYGRTGKLKNVILGLTKAKEYDYLATYNIKFYEYDAVRRCPGKQIYLKDVRVEPENKTYKLEIPVEELDIVFSENGICVGVEIINTKYEGKLKSMATMAPRISFTHTDMQVLSWSRFINKEWHTGTTKSPFKEGFVNAMILIDVVIQK